jgi:tetratricopeptide (TPR) repeat protein
VFALVVSVMLIVPAARTIAATAPATGKEGEKVQPTLTPEERAAQDLLKRYADEQEVLTQEKRHRAAQHVRVGRDQFDMQAFKAALRHFEKAIELDPMNKEAQQYLKKSRSMLNLSDRRFGDWAAEYARHRAIALEVQKTELINLFAAARALYDKQRYSEAIEAFTRAGARAKYLSAFADTKKLAEDADVHIQKSLAGIEEKRRRDDETRRAAAIRRGAELRERREGLIGERTRARLKQAQVLFEQHRYEDARKVCEEILRDDPTSGPAETLLETATQVARDREIEKGVKNRRVETGRHWQQTRAWSVPQYELVYMPRDRFEEVRSRSAAAAIGGDVHKPEEWENRIKEAMGKKISFDFVETPLQDVISFISSLVEVTIVLDTEAIKEEAPAVTLKVTDMRLEAALNWVLKLVGLKYTLKDEAIFISKPDRIHDKPILRMYDVTDLTIDIKNFQGRQQALASDGGYSSTGSSGSGGGGGGGGGDSIGEDFFGTEDEDDEEDRLTGETLVEFIKRTIAPGTWADDKLEGGGDEF